MARGRYTNPLDDTHTSYNVDITGIPPSWRMTKSSGAQTFNDETWTKVDFSSTSYGWEEGNGYSGYMGIDTSNKRFRIGLGGVYYCQTLIMFANANLDQKRFYCVFRKNGETITYPQRLYTAADMDGTAKYHTLRHSQLVRLKEGEFVEVYLKSRDGNVAMYASAGWSSFEGFYVGPGDYSEFDALHYTLNN